MEVESPNEKKKMQAFYHCPTVYARAFCVDVLSESEALKHREKEWVFWLNVTSSTYKMKSSFCLQLIISIDLFQGSLGTL